MPLRACSLDLVPQHLRTGDRCEDPSAAPHAYSPLLYTDRFGNSLLLSPSAKVLLNDVVL